MRWMGRRKKAVASLSLEELNLRHGPSSSGLQGSAARDDASGRSGREHLGLRPRKQGTCARPATLGGHTSCRYGIGE